MAPESGLHRTRGSFGHEARAEAVVLSGDATRAAALVLACGLSAGLGLALGQLLQRRRRLG